MERDTHKIHTTHRADTRVSISFIKKEIDDDDDDTGTPPHIYIYVLCVFGKACAMCVLPFACVLR